MIERGPEPLPVLPGGAVVGADLPVGRDPRPLWRESIALLPDLGRLLRALATDPRVPGRAKLVAGAAVAYVAGPVDLLPDVFAVGGVDDVVVVLLAVRFLVATAGYDLVRELWTGTDDGFGLVIVLAGVRD